MNNNDLLNDYYTSFKNIGDNITSVETYINEIRKIPLLSAEEENKLAKMYFDNHDMDARMKLIEHNLRLCIKPASRYNNKGVPFMDLIEYANLGLIKAIDKFDPYKGFKLSTYATYWINNILSYNYNSNINIVNIPYKEKNNIDKYVRLKSELSCKLGREVTYNDVLKYIDIDVDEINYYESVIMPITSINTIVSDSDNTELLEFIPDDKIDDFDSMLIDTEFKNKIMSVLDGLSKKQKMVIMLRYGLYDGVCYTLEQTAKKLFVLGITDKEFSHQNISRIEGLVLKKLHDNKKLIKLRDNY